MIIVYLFGGLILLLLVVAAFMPNSFHIQKSIVIDRQRPYVIERISNLNYYSRWNPWQQTDPTSKQTVTGTPGTPGHLYSWVGKKVGVGSLQLLSADEKEVHFQLEFLKPWKASAKDNWFFESIAENETKVSWDNIGELPWPIARLMGPVLKKNLNHQFEKGLKNLKEMCEAS